MIYSPETPLTEEQINQLNDDDLFAYLDSRAEYLKKYSRPLDTYHTKQFLAATKGGEVTAEELKMAKEIGKAGDEAKIDEIINAEVKLGGNPKFKDDTIKVKTHRSQWFD
jgi:hypothetical protein